MGLRHAKTSAKADGADATQVRPSDWNADHVIVGTLPLPLTAAPETPAADTVGLFGREVGGRMLPAFIGPSGLDSSLQAHLGRNKVMSAEPAGNGTAITYCGCALTAVGTATGKNFATTNLYTQMRGLEYLVTTAATTAVAGFRHAAAQLWRGNAPGRGGFHYITRFGPATGVATATSRLFVGLRNVVTAATDVEPSTLLNCIGVGYDAADANLQIFHNDASGACTKVDLGASFPVPTTDRTKVYELALFAPPNGSGITWGVTDLDTGAVATGTATTDIPAATMALGPMGYASAGGTSSVIGLCLFGLYIETDY